MCDHWLRQTDANSLQYFSWRLLDGHCIGLLQGKLPPTECEYETSLLFAQHKEDVSVVHSFAKKNWQVFCHAASLMSLNTSSSVLLKWLWCWRSSSICIWIDSSRSSCSCSCSLAFSLGVEEVSMLVVGGFVFALSLLQLRMLLCLHRF